MFLGRNRPMFRERQAMAGARTEPFCCVCISLHRLSETSAIRYRYNHLSSGVCQCSRKGIPWQESDAQRMTIKRMLWLLFCILSRCSRWHFPSLIVAFSAHEASHISLLSIYLFYYISLTISSQPLIIWHIQQALLFTNWKLK